MFALATVMLPPKSRSPSPRLKGKRLLSPLKSPKKDNYQNICEQLSPVYSKNLRTLIGDPNLDYSDCMGEDIEDDDHISVTVEEQTFKFKDPRIKLKGHTSPTPKFVKIPKKVITNVLGNVSPRLAKKLDSEDTKSVGPIWPNAMGTYSRGVSMEGNSGTTSPREPTMSALRVQAHLQEQKELKVALRELMRDPARPPSSNSNISDESDDSDDSDDEFYKDAPANSDSRKINKKIRTPQNSVSSEYNLTVPEANLMTFDSDSSRGILNPDVFITLDRPSPAEPGTEAEFLDETLETAFGSLSLCNLPTLTPQDLSKASINDVKNVHVTSNFIVLETYANDQLFSV